MRRALLVFWALLLSFTAAQAEPSDWDKVEKALGRTGARQADMIKIAFPRTDLSVKIGEILVEPGLALTSWVAFKPTGMGNDVMMMGDIALLETEVAPVTAKLVAEGIQVTAIHNHLLGSVPVIMYVHFNGEGNPDKLAAAMHSVLSATGTPAGVPAAAAADGPPADWRKVEAIFGKEGQKKGNLLQLSFPRRGKITEKGMVIPPFMGMATGINLQRVGGKAVATGDFVLIGTEVNPVIRELVLHGITVTAVHSHMLFESPRLFFLHFWGHNDPETLARGIAAALGRVDPAK